MIHNHMIRPDKIRLLCLVILVLICFASSGISVFAAQDQDLSVTYGSVVVDTGAGISVPRIEVETENGNGASLEKTDGYVNAQIRITDTDGSALSGSILFKVRGNSTAMTHVLKKGFNFKFSSKTEVLGMGKGKKWCLLANCFDPTLLRNYTAFELAREMGLPFTSEQRIVELYLDGSYHGCYIVCEPVQEGKDRVNIDIESNGGMKDFLMELEATRQEDGVTYITAGGLRFAVSEPEEPNEAQTAYISGVVNDIVNVIKSGDEEQIRACIDVPSFAAYYLLNEYAKTLDFGFSSVFFFYRNSKLYAGPAWDYDLALGNANGNISSAAAKAGSVPDGIMQNEKNLYRWLCSKDWFMEEVKNVYREHYDYIQNISADGGLLDTLRSDYADVISRNFEKWNVRKHWINYQKAPLATYDDNFAYLKNWCSERNAWLTEYYDLFPEPVVILGDADGDGMVNILDATTIQRHLASLTTKTYIEQAADADENGEVDILDATAVQRWLAGFSGHESIGQPIG